MTAPMVKKYHKCIPTNMLNELFIYQNYIPTYLLKATAIIRVYKSKHKKRSQYNRHDLLIVLFTF